MAKEERVILTRAARRKAGIPPPTPLFSPTRPPPGRDETLLKHEDSPDSSTSSSSSEGTEENAAKNNSKQKKRRKKREKKLWVQCDNRSCRKWRTLPPNTVTDLSQDWFCHMHPDPAQSSCSIPEEKERVSRKKKRYTFSLLESGELVWVKMAGFCPWPAVVSPDPWSEGQSVCEEREGRIYHIEFFGKHHTHNWIVEDKVEPYHGREVKPELGPLKMSSSLIRAMEEAEELMKLTPRQRLERCVFQSSRDSSAPTTSADGKDQQSKILPHKKKKRRPPNSTKKFLASNSPLPMTTTKLLKSSHPATTFTGPLKAANATMEAKKQTVRQQPQKMVGEGATSSLAASGLLLPHGSSASGGQEIQLLLKSLGIPFYTQAVPTTTGNSAVTAIKLDSLRDPLAPIVNRQSVLTAPNPVQRGVQEKKRAQKNPNPREKKAKASVGKGVKQTTAHLPPSDRSVGQCSHSSSPHQRPHEFRQLAEEAEGELKQMEDMLSLFAPSPPPPRSPHSSTAAAANPPATGKAVDSSIECVLSEMAEIEGLLQDLDNAQLVPYPDL